MEKKWIKPYDHKFSVMSDGSFVYNGKADYVCVPEKINGITVTKLRGLHGSNGMFSLNPNIKGVMLEKPENILSLAGLFKLNASEQIDLGELNTSSVVDMSEMFTECKAINLNLTNIDTSKVEDMSGMFEGCKFASLDLSNFNVRNVIDMHDMFRDCNIELLDLSSFDTSNVENMNNIFKNSKIKVGYALNSKESEKFNKLLGNEVFRIKEITMTTGLSLTDVKTDNIAEQKDEDLKIVSQKEKPEEHSDDNNIIRRGVFFANTKKPWLYFWLVAIVVGIFAGIIQILINDASDFKFPVSAIILGVYWLIFAPTKVRKVNKK